MSTVLGSMSASRIFTYRSVDGGRKRTFLGILVVVEFREKRFANGFSCPHCHRTHIHRHGEHKDRWRYSCVDCGMTFNDAARFAARTHPLQR